MAAAASRRFSGAVCLATWVAVGGAVVDRAVGAVDLAAVSVAAVDSAAAVVLEEALAVVVISAAEVREAVGNRGLTPMVNTDLRGMDQSRWLRRRYRKV